VSLILKGLKDLRFYIYYNKMNKQQVLNELVKVNMNIIKNIMDDKECSLNEAIVIWMKINRNKINNYLIIHADE